MVEIIDHKVILIEVSEHESDFSDADIDLETVERFKILARDRVPSIEQETDLLALMQRLNLLSGAKYKRAAVVLFGKNVQKYVLQARIKIGKFLIDTEVITTDIVEGNLIQQVDRTLDILRTKYLLSYISYEGIHRREKLVYPYDALREAILNAIIHREYFVSSEIQIRVYDDKLIIGNEARLQDITVEDLSKSHPSRPHNKLIADVFYKAGFIESWGRGTQRIIDKCITEGLPAPVYEYKMGFLYLVFSNERVNERVNELSETEKKVYLILKENPNIIQKQLAQEVNYTEQYIRKIIKILKDKGMIERIGSDKNGYWQIIDQNDN